jgi:hypothetical protein
MSQAEHNQARWRLPSVAPPPTTILFLEEANVLAGTKSLSHMLTSIYAKADKRLRAQRCQHCFMHWPAHLDQGIGVSSKVGTAAGSGEDQVAGGNAPRIKPQTGQEVPQPPLQTVIAGAPASPTLIAVSRPRGWRVGENEIGMGAHRGCGLHDRITARIVAQNVDARRAREGGATTIEDLTAALSQPGVDVAGDVLNHCRRLL